MWACRTQEHKVITSSETEPSYINKIVKMISSQDNLSQLTKFGLKHHQNKLIYRLISKYKGTFHALTAKAVVAVTRKYVILFLFDNGYQFSNLK